MAGLSLVMLLSVAALSSSLGLGSLYVNTSLLLSLLSLHVLISARFLKDISSLHALGMAFLTIAALTLTILAHRAGELHVGMMAGTVMLFVAIPLVPWALRETSIVIGLTYLLLTSSLSAVPGRFASESLWVLQMLIFGAAVIVVVMTGRNTFIRKQDMRARFDLENAHNDMELLSLQDHLTGAWNRRYLDLHFPNFARRCQAKKKTLHVAVLDIDNFKGINDQFGHDVGDKILIGVADTFVRHLGSKGRLIRLGGDEFQIIYCGDDLDFLIASAVEELQESTIARDLVGDRSVTLSAGISSTPPGQIANAENLYKKADRALYSSKQDKPRLPESAVALTRTGTWKI